LCTTCQPMMEDTPAKKRSCSSRMFLLDGFVVHAVISLFVVAYVVYMQLQINALQREVGGDASTIVNSCKKLKELKAILTSRRVSSWCGNQWDEQLGKMKVRKVKKLLNNNHKISRRDVVGAPTEDGGTKAVENNRKFSVQVNETKKLDEQNFPSILGNTQDTRRGPPGPQGPPGPRGPPGPAGLGMYPAKITASALSGSANQSVSVNLTCTAFGNPLPTIEWNTNARNTRCLLKSIT